MAFCNACKNQVPDGTKFCPYCGEPILQQPQQRPAPQFYAQDEQPAEPAKPNPKRPATVVVNEEPVRQQPQYQQPEPQPQPQYQQPEPQPQYQQPEPQPQPHYQQPEPQPQPQYQQPEPEVEEIEVTDTGYSNEKQLRVYGLIMFIIMCVVAFGLIIAGINAASGWYGNFLMFLMFLLYAVLVVLIGWGGWTLMKVLSNISTNIHEMNMRMRG